MFSSSLATGFLDIVTNFRTSPNGELLAGLTKMPPLLGERAGVRASLGLQLQRYGPGERESLAVSTPPQLRSGAVSRCTRRPLRSAFRLFICRSFDTLRRC